MMRLRFLFLLCAALTLAACGNNSVPDETGDISEVTNTAPVNEKAKDGRIVISALPKVSEPNACILPITVTNGTDVETTVSMMQFTITGKGEPDSGNMFGQTVAPGETNTARLLFPTRQCNELLEITAPNVTCKTGDADCSEKVEFEAGEGLAFTRG